MAAGVGAQLERLPWAPPAQGGARAGAVRPAAGAVHPLLLKGEPPHLFNFLALRFDPHAMAEIRQAAEQVRQLSAAALHARSRPPVQIASA